MNENENKPAIEVDTAKRRVLFFRCESATEMEQLAMQRLAELTRAAVSQLRSKKDKEQRRQLNRERHVISQWLTGGDARDQLKLAKQLTEPFHAHDAPALARETFAIGPGTR